MVKNNISKVLEFNCRLGDPETQCLMMQMESDLLDAILQALDGEEPKITWKNGATMGVVIASGGYPSSYKNGVPINIGNIKNAKTISCWNKSINDKLMTNGGRVFSLNYSSNSMDDCKRYIYDNIEEINFDGMILEQILEILMSLNDKIANELNHFLKIITYKNEAEADESSN